MTVSSDYTAYVIEQLAALPRVSSRRMFGGVGLYSDGLFFGLIAYDTLYMKVDDGNRADYVARGSKPFCPFPDKSEFSMNYFDVPADLLEDPETLCAWARKSVAVAFVAAQSKSKSKSNSKSKSKTKTKPGKKSARTSKARK